MNSIELDIKNLYELQRDSKMRPVAVKTIPKLRQNIAPLCPVESQYCDYKKGLTAKHMRLPYVPIIREFYYSKKSYLPTCGVLQILERRTEK